MSIEFFNTGTSYANYAGTLGTITGHPLTIMAWVYRTDLTANADVLVHYGAGGGVNTDSVSLRTTATAQALARAYDTASGNSTTTETAMASAWHHYAGVFASTSSRTAYLDGAAATENTTAKTFSSSFDELYLGRELGSTSFNFGGYLGHVAIWKSALTAGQIASLAGGANPQAIDGANLVAYYPMTSSGSPETDIIGGYDLTLNGSTAYNAADPTVDAYSTYKPRLMLMGIG